MLVFLGCKSLEPDLVEVTCADGVAMSMTALGVRTSRPT